jgi:hypothetical protein
MLSALIKLADIPVFKRVVGVEEIAGGMPVGGIALMIPLNRYDEALQLLNVKIDEGELEKESINADNICDQE